MAGAFIHQAYVAAGYFVDQLDISLAVTESADTALGALTVISSVVLGSTEPTDVAALTTYVFTPAVLVTVEQPDQAHLKVFSAGFTFADVEVARVPWENRSASVPHEPFEDELPDDISASVYPRQRM